jgi:nucleotide-binding universal stress UspA family protein
MTMTIVVGFVPTPQGQAAIAQAAHEARVRQTDLVVVSSQDPTLEKSKDAVQRLQAELDAAAARLAEDGLSHQVRTFDRGTLPSEDLLEVADEVDADLIVIGLRRRSTLGKFVLGSNAQRILMDANRPVLSVKAD